MGEAMEWNPGLLLSTSSGYWRSCTIHAGVRLGVFTEIGGGKSTAADIAAKLAVDEKALGLLLNALSALGLLIKEKDLFANTPFAKKHLVKDAPDYLGYIIMHHHFLVDGWQQLHDAVANGTAVPEKPHDEERKRESFLMGMFNIAMSIAPQIASLVDLSGRKQLLDLGGGPGTHAIFFCKANAQLSATIFDRPTTAPFARETVKKFGFEDRIGFVGGDFTLDPIPGSYDAAWLSQILHSNGPDQCQNIINKAVGVLEPGGLIMIHDFFLNDSMDGPIFPALFSLNMLLNNGVGRSYSEKEVTAMLEKAGINDIQRLPFQGPNDSAVLCGIT